jgi:hypothetical protein
MSILQFIFTTIIKINKIEKCKKNSSLVLLKMPTKFASVTTY